MLKILMFQILYIIYCLKYYIFYILYILNIILNGNNMRLLSTLSLILTFEPQ